LVELLEISMQRCAKR